MLRRLATPRVLGAVVGLVVFVLVFSNLVVFLAKDKCLDAGGSWNSSESTCDLSGPERSMWPMATAVTSLLSGIVAGFAGLVSALASRRILRARNGGAGVA